jgi:hypothetical protein
LEQTWNITEEKATEKKQYIENIDIVYDFFNIVIEHPACVFPMLDILYTVYTPRVSTDPLNRDYFDVMNVYLSHLMMAQEGRNM